MYTNELIQELICCPKMVVDAPKEMKKGRADYFKKNFTLRSIDNTYNFSGYIIQNSTFAENFSIGLIYNSKEDKGKITLLRCNGLHGMTRELHHATCHIHTAIAEDLNNGIKVERNIKQTNEYSTLEDAIQFFVKYISIIPMDRQKHFPPPAGQIGLFSDHY
jgi:hypothetical protein